MSVTILTPAIIERSERTLPKCIASVAAQTLRPENHVIVFDYLRQGTAITLNRALAAASSEWVMPLADDGDMSNPYCIAEHVAMARMLPEAGVIWSWPIFRNEQGERIQPFNTNPPPKPPGIPSMVMIRRRVLLEFGGWPITEFGEDRALFNLLIESGVQFAQAPSDLYTYHMHSKSKSQSGRAE